jgi:hypothetical protein
MKGYERFNALVTASINNRFLPIRERHFVVLSFSRSGLGHPVI